MHFLYEIPGLLEATALTLLLDLGEEVVALVINEDERGEILHFDFPDGFHAELGVFEKFYLLDAVLGKDGGRTSDRAEVESAMFVAGVGHLARAVALGDHYHRASGSLELVDIRVHTSGGCGSE